MRSPIDYVPKDYSRTYNIGRSKHGKTYNTDVSPELIFAEYRRYVEDAGLRFERYEGFATEELKNKLYLIKSTEPRGSSRSLQCKNLL